MAKNYQLIETAYSYTKSNKNKPLSKGGTLIKHNKQGKVNKNYEFIKHCHTYTGI